MIKDSFEIHVSIQHMSLIDGFGEWVCWLLVEIYVFHDVDGLTWNSVRNDGREDSISFWFVVMMWAQIWVVTMKPKHTKKCNFFGRCHWSVITSDANPDVILEPRYHGNQFTWPSKHVWQELENMVIWEQERLAANSA